MCIELTGQMSFYDSPDIWCGRTSQEHSAAENPREQTSELSWRKLPAWSNLTLMFLCLPNGKRRESSSATDTVSLGGFTTHSTSVYRRGEEESPWSRTLMGIPLPTSYLSELNVGESPIHPIESHLTDVLETDAEYGKVSAGERDARKSVRRDRRVSADLGRNPRQRHGEMGFRDRGFPHRRNEISLRGGLV